MHGIRPEFVGTAAGLQPALRWKEALGEDSTSLGIHISPRLPRHRLSCNVAVAWMVGLAPEPPAAHITTARAGEASRYYDGENIDIDIYIIAESARVLPWR
jgi:hypothetical protein